MNRTTVRLMALVATAALAACGTTDLVVGELTEVEAQDLAGAILVATFSGTGDVPQPGQGANGPQPAPFEYSYSVDGEVPCPQGGLVAVEAELSVQGDTESEAGSVTYAMRQVHQGCGVTSENGREFVLDGHPALELGFMVVNNGQGVVEWGGSVEGGVTWVTGDRTGDCDANLEFSGRQEGEQSVSGEISGTLCGFEVSRSFSIG